MVAALLEVHHDIEEGDGLTASCVQLLKVPGQNPLVDFPASHHISTDERVCLTGIVSCSHMLLI